jgi:hypothetical protein
MVNMAAVVVVVYTGCSRPTCPRQTRTGPGSAPANQTPFALPTPQRAQATLSTAQLTLGVLLARLFRNTATFYHGKPIDEPTNIHPALVNPVEDIGLLGHAVINLACRELSPGPGFGSLAENIRLGSDIITVHGYCAFT